MIVPAKISGKVLVVGPEYRNHRGGIGAVIASHRELFEAFHFVPTYNYSTNPVKMLSFFFLSVFNIFGKLRRHREIEIVHVHSSQKGSIFRKFIVMFVVKFIFRKKFINHTHGSHFQVFYAKSNVITKRLVKFYLQKTDLTLTVSNSWKKYYEQTFSLSNVQKLNNIINIPSVRSVSGEEADKIRLLFLGQVGSRKGIFDLIEVLQKNRDKVKRKIKLTVGGDGETEKLKKAIAEYQLEDVVDFKGWISGDQKVQCFLGSDIYILPSYNEGMPVSILEAMSYGKAVISTNIAGIPEIVAHDINGFVINPGDHDALWNALNQYIDDPQKIKDHGHQSARLVSDYTPEAVVPQIERIYMSLMN